MSNINLKKTLDIGDIVKLRNGDWYIYTGKKFWRENIYINIDYYEDNLLFYGFDKGLDIVKVTRGDNVYNINNAGIEFNEVVFERKDTDLFYLSYEELHRRLWRDIAEGKVKGKAEWFKINNELIEPKNLCFACQEAIERYKNKKFFWIDRGFCGQCPIKKETDKLCCGGLYKEYTSASFLGLEDEKRRLAKKIAELEWKK